jgi:hypothetical protein
VEIDENGVVITNGVEQSDAELREKKDGSTDPPLS